MDYGQLEADRFLGQLEPVNFGPTGPDRFWANWNHIVFKDKLLMEFMKKYIQGVP